MQKTDPSTSRTNIPNNLNYSKLEFSKIRPDAFETTRCRVRTLKTPKYEWLWNSKSSRLNLKLWKVMRTVLVEDFNVTFVKSGLGLVSFNDNHDWRKYIFKDFGLNVHGWAIINFDLLKVSELACPRKTTKNFDDWFTFTLGWTLSLSELYKVLNNSFEETGY